MDLEKNFPGPSRSSTPVSSYTSRIPINRHKQRIIRYVLLFSIFCFFIHVTSNFITLRPVRQIQHKFKPHENASLPQESRRAAVKKEFLHAWYGYKDHAWMADSLMSLSGDRKEQFCGWSATLVDSLDTLYIMGLMSEFEEAVDAVMLIDFIEVTRVDDDSDVYAEQIPFPGLAGTVAGKPRRCIVNLFESVIRYLGGMLAAYDLSGDERLKNKLIELGYMLHRAWRTENGMPCSYCNPVAMAGNQTLDASNDVPLADIGSFYLELARLSQITGDESFYGTVETMTEVMHRTQNGSAIAGLWPERVDAAAVTNSTVELQTREHAYSLGALSDSAYEYLVKGHLMLGGLTKSYKQMWTVAATAISDTMLFRASIPDWETRDVLFSGVVRQQDNETVLEARTQHLACFAGGMYAMSAKIFDRPADLDIGQALTEGCVWAYEHNTATGIMPETFSLLPCPNVTQQCEFNETLWDMIRTEPFSVPEICGGRVNCATSIDYPDGYLASIDTRYILRPEAIESVFIMYRITGDERWRDAGWTMFESIIENTRTPYGHASLISAMELRSTRKYVNGKEVFVDAASQNNEMESFWLAETLKYFYLLFSETDLISLDDFVFNTEAHPLRLQSSSRGFGR